MMEEIIGANYDSLSYGTYQRLPVSSDYPVVFNDIISSWKAHGKWSLEFFKTRYADYKILADRTLKGETKFIQSTFANYIAYVQVSEDSIPYYGKSSIHLDTELKDDYQTDEIFECWYRKWHQEHPGQEEKFNLSNLYFAPRNAKTLLHKDLWGTSFWNALFEGEKLWLFFREEDEQFLYDLQVDPFAPDLNKYPLYDNAKPIVHVQKAGELVYAPGNAIHAVLTIQPSLSLSENFINQDNYRFVLKTFEKKGYSNAISKLNLMVECYSN